MKKLIEYVSDVGEQKIALGHFNISDIVALKAIFEAARELSAQVGSAWGGNLPVMIGVSEGEREFIGVRQAAALVKSLREEYGYPIFLNADHTHSLEKAREAAEAGFDEVLFDPTPNFVGKGVGGGKLPLSENIAQTKAVVRELKSINPAIIVEGELGYIGSSSQIRKEIPAGAAVKPEDLTTPEQAEQFVRETGVDMLAPAVGNIHGMFADMPEPTLDIARIAAIKAAVKIPLVLHGGSGNSDDDFKNAIQAGINIVHINTEIRLAWRKGLEAGLAKNPEEIAPYKILPDAVNAVKKIVSERLNLFSGR